MASYSAVLDEIPNNSEEAQRIDQDNQQIQQSGYIPTNTKIKDEVGLAFSGGGIRSASLCSGVLRRMLQKDVPNKVKTMYLSCVSGGGYTASAYLDWKLQKVVDGTWHTKFFENMRNHSGHMCNWQNVLIGLWDSICLLIVVLVVVVIMPCIIWFPYAFPLAYAVDFLFGDILRAPSICEGGRRTALNASMLSNMTRPQILRALRRVCEPPTERVLLFVVPLIVWLTFFCLSRFITRFCFATRVSRLNGTFRFVSSVAGLLFFMTVFPWFIDYFISRTRVWVQVLIVFVTPVFWFFFPIIRNYASLFLIIYVYAFVVSYRVYQESKLGIEYSADGFNIALYVSAVLLWIIPITGAFHQGIVHAFNRWRLVRAFYHQVDATTILAGSNFARRLFKGPNTMPPEKVVKMSNLSDPLITPQFICNVTVNDWHLEEHSSKVPDYTLLTMSPSRNEIIDQHYYKKSYHMGKVEDDFRIIDNQPLSRTLYPRHIGLAQAMATSAAALALDMGSYDSKLRTVGGLQAILGLGMGETIVSDLSNEERKNCCWKFVVPLLAELGQGLPLVTFPIVYFTGGDERWLTTGVLFYFIIVGLLALIAVQPTGSETPAKTEKLTRWCIVHVFFVRFLRNLMKVVNKGLNPPALLRLSDGGHFENLALLPLLKMKLKRIVVVNGGNTPEDDYGEPLLHALNLARKKLHCSFTGMDGRDVNEDLRAKFLDAPNAPRSYKFKVQYYTKDWEGNEVKDKDEGEIIFIAPRRPQAKQSDTQVITWGDVEQGTLNDKQNKWGTGPELTKEEVDSLTWCCCECCHSSRKTCQWLSDRLCGSFPQHTTANQFFTPTMFTAYHREGYYACYKAEAAEFLLGDHNSSSNPSQS